MPNRLRQLKIKEDALAELEDVFESILHRVEIVARLDNEIGELEKRLDPQSNHDEFQSMLTRCRMLLHLTRKDGQAAFAPYALSAIDYLLKRYIKARSIDEIDFDLSTRLIDEIFRLFNIDSDLQEAFP